MKERFAVQAICNLGNADVDSAQLAAVLGIGLGVIGDLLALIQGLVAITLDSGEVHKNILAAHVVRYKAETLISVVPFNSTVIHYSTSFKMLFRPYKTKNTGSC